MLGLVEARLGVARLSRAEVRRHLARLVVAHDLAARVGSNEHHVRAFHVGVDARRIERKPGTDLVAHRRVDLGEADFHLFAEARFSTGSTVEVTPRT